MAFQTALSGLNAAQANLSVTGNNIANSSTTGFKKSRSEFGDIYATSFGGSTSTNIGAGVRLTNVSQQFSQGNIEFTENSLDLAMSGQGFFVVQDTDGTELYTRSGQFGVDREGYVVNSYGQTLQSYPVNSAGSVTSFSATDLRLSTDTNPANATSAIGINVNLDAATPAVNPLAGSATAGTTTISDLGLSDTAGLVAWADITLGYTDNGNVPPLSTDFSDSTGGWAVGSYNDTTHVVTLTKGGETLDVTLSGTPVGGDTWQIAQTNQFDPTDLSTYNFSTSCTVYDSLGTAHTATLYFAKYATNSANEWQMFSSITDVDGTTTFSTDGTDLGSGVSSQTVTFDASGQLVTGMPLDIFSSGYTPSTGAQAINIAIDLGSSTQYSGDSTINSLVQDGYTTGRLSGIDIGDDGVVYARYTNGQSSLLGAVAVANFANPQGLSQVGNSAWSASFDSGDVVYGQANTGTFGAIQSGALEASNVDLSKQLVNMIIAQRDFQANAKMISAEDQVTQTIINIR